MKNLRDESQFKYPENMCKLASFGVEFRSGMLSEVRQLAQIPNSWLAGLIYDNLWFLIHADLRYLNRDF